MKKRYELIHSPDKFANREVAISRKLLIGIYPNYFKWMQCLKLKAIYFNAKIWLPQLFLKS